MKLSGISLAIFLAAPVAFAQSPSELKTAVNRALPILQKSAAEFVAKRACVSCHHNALALLTFHMARDRGLSIDPKILGAVEDKTFRELRGPNAVDDAVQGANLSDPTPNESYLLMAAHAAGLSGRSTTLGIYAMRMARWQRDGHWITSDFRPPHSSSLFTATATAVRAIQLYMPEELAVERDAVVRSARQWLVMTHANSTEDAAFRLMGLVWANAPPSDVAAAKADLLALQKPNGGWPQLPGYDADAYSTGESLFALHEAGVSVADGKRQKGMAFLLSTQARDGTWRVRSRMLSPAEVSPMYFSTGFPYKKDEFLSYAGSSWAVMALLSAIPSSAASTSSSSIATVEDNPAPWVRPALFQTADGLTALLDSGLDPNSRTPHGTTLLMLAAPDADKVRLLLARGADAKVRTASGVDVLTIASQNYGTSVALRLLIDAGAEPEAPEGVRVRHSPLVYASMTGDLENVKLLLAHGAKPSAEALAEGVTFGNPEVVRALAAAGADVRITESSGINLLHWATITNRSTVIPVLAAAGAPIDGVDDFGFTPLMYAATVDEGDSKTLKALLRAGADRRVRNPDGRTPLEQARRYKHSELADVLK